MDLTKLLANNSINSSECAVILLLESKPAKNDEIQKEFNWHRLKLYRVLSSLLDRRIIKLSGDTYTLNTDYKLWRINKCSKNEHKSSQGVFSQKFTKELQNELKRYLRNRRINLDDCDDIVQESGLKAFNSMGNYHDGDFRAWMFQIMKNTMRDYFRRKKEYQMFENEEVIDESETVSREYLDFIERMNNLANDFKIPLLLSDLGVSYQSISVYCNVPIGTVKSRIHRAKEVLKST
jgi:RNA polymerase sigma factor (sigma-70 family)